MEGGAREADCQPCKLGFFCTTAASELEACPAGMYDRAATIGAATIDECRCQAGFFVSTTPNCTSSAASGGGAPPECVQQWRCEECPEHTQCEWPNATLHVEEAILMFLQMAASCFKSDLHTPEKPQSNSF